VSFSWSVGAVWRRYREFLRSFLEEVQGPLVNWSAEIWKVQWRTAVSYLSSYFAFYVFTPILFRFHGAVLAGQFGMSLSLVGALAGIATMWSAPRGPQFAVMIARREYAALDALLSRVAVATSVVLLAGALVMWGGVYVLSLVGHPFSTRLLPPMPMAFLLVGMVLSTLPHPTLVYMRAHKREPYVAVSVTSAAMIGVMALVFGKWYGAMGVSVAFMASHAVLLPWYIGIFARCRREWHGDAPGQASGTA
jgi:O-antigen/teichoic acid export membrane protein